MTMASGSSFVLPLLCPANAPSGERFGASYVIRCVTGAGAGERDGGTGRFSRLLTATCSCWPRLADGSILCCLRRLDTSVPFPVLGSVSVEPCHATHLWAITLLYFCHPVKRAASSSFFFFKGVEIFCACSTPSASSDCTRVSCQAQSFGAASAVVCSARMQFVRRK